MARKSLVARENKRTMLEKKHRSKREKVKIELKLAQKKQDMVKVMELNRQLQDLPKNSSPTRRRNRCQLTGRPRGNVRKFGVCMKKLRELMGEGLIPGLVMASW